MTKKKKVKSKAERSDRPGRTLVRSAHSPRIRVTSDPVGESMTVQSFKDECDINKIMARYVKTGVITHLNPAEPRYGFAPAGDFLGAMSLVTQAQQSFDELPAEVRRKFDNDPGKFLDFIDDPANEAELAEMGLTVPDEGFSVPAEQGLESPESDSQAAGEPKGDPVTPAAESADAPP